MMFEPKYIEMFKKMINEVQKPVLEENFNDFITLFKFIMNKNTEDPMLKAAAIQYMVVFSAMADDLLESKTFKMMRRVINFFTGISKTFCEVFDFDFDDDKVENFFKSWFPRTMAEGYKLNAMLNEISLARMAEFNEDPEMAIIVKRIEESIKKYQPVATQILDSVNDDDEETDPTSHVEGIKFSKDLHQATFNKSEN